MIELNAQTNHVHLLVKIPPSQSVSELLGAVKWRKTLAK